MVAEAKMVASMKNSARLYLPWPVVSAFVASCGSRPAEAQPGRRENPSSRLLKKSFCEAVGV